MEKVAFYSFAKISVSLCKRISAYIDGPWDAVAYMRMTQKVEAIFPLHNLYRSIKVTTADLNRLLLHLPTKKKKRSTNSYLFNFYILYCTRFWSPFLLELDSFCKHLFYKFRKSSYLAFLKSK